MPLPAATMVYRPASASSSGSGTFLWPGTEDPVSFAYSVTPNKKGKNLQGGLIVVRETAEGTYEVFAQLKAAPGLKSPVMSDISRPRSR